MTFVEGPNPESDILPAPSMVPVPPTPGDVARTPRHLAPDTFSVEKKGAGWLLFAATILGITGIMRIFDAIWAFRYHGVLPSDLEGAIFGHSLKTYGWVYLVVGIVLIVCSLGVVVSSSQIARWIGVVAAAGVAISAIWWMPYYPVWSLTYIGAGVLAMYALIVYGAQDEVSA